MGKGTGSTGVREMEKPMKWRAGDWVEVRSKEEILGTLDGRGRLEELPFMPQMFQYCGQRFQVYKRAHKTCDTVNRTGGRRLSRAVHLELRCDGEAYGGCQAACLLFWKEAWLKPVDKADRHAGPSSSESNAGAIPTSDSTSCTEADVWAGTRAADQSATDEPTYVCQTTLLPYITTFLPWWDVRQYLEDYTSGNFTVGRLFCGFVYAGYWELLEHSGAKIGPCTDQVLRQISPPLGRVALSRERWERYPRIKAHQPSLSTSSPGNSFASGRTTKFLRL